MDTQTLFQLTQEANEIREILWENGGELTPELEERMEQNSASLAVKTDSYGALIRSFTSAASTLDAEIKRLQALKKTADNAAESLKGRVLRSMVENEQTNLDGIKTKFFLRSSERTITNDEEILAPYYFAIEAVRSTLPPYVQLGDLKVSKQVIKDMYKKDGILIPGAMIEKNWSVIMK